MKPHEQEWKAQGNGVVAVSDAVVIKVEVAPWRLPRTTDMDDWEKAATVSQDVTTFIAAAPDMVRALMEFLPGGHSMECGNQTHGDDACSDECRRARAALRKAGVL